MARRGILAEQTEDQRTLAERSAEVGGDETRWLAFLPCQNPYLGVRHPHPKAQACPRRRPGRTIRCVDINHFSRRRLAAAAVCGLDHGGLLGRREFQRGYIVDEQALGQVKKGMSGEQVLQTLGTPSTVSTVGNKSWYYISQTSQASSSSCRNPLSISRSRQFISTTVCKSSAWPSMASRTARCSTSSAAPRPSGGEETSFIGQLFRGYGRFNPFGPDPAAHGEWLWPGPSRPFLSATCRCERRRQDRPTWKNPAARTAGFSSFRGGAPSRSATGSPEAAGR